MQMSTMMIGRGSDFSTGGPELSGTKLVAVAMNSRILRVGEVSFPASSVFIFPAKHNINKNKVSLSIGCLVAPVR